MYTGLIMEIYHPEKETPDSLGVETLSYETILNLFNETTV